MTNTDNLKKITNILSPPAVLEQAAEECVELAHACLKMARYLRAENPTPRTLHEVVTNLQEETADVTLLINCLHTLGVIDLDKSAEICEQKANRWIGRLEGSKK